MKTYFLLALLLFPVAAIAQTQSVDPNQPVQGLNTPGAAAMDETMESLHGVLSQPLIVCQTMESMKFTHETEDPNARLSEPNNVVFKAAVLQDMGINTSPASGEDPIKVIFKADGNVVYKGQDITQTLQTYCNNNNLGFGIQ